MDIPTLHNILLHTFSTNEADRNAAENALQTLHEQRRSLSLLVELAQNEKDIQREIRQAAAVSLKNVVQKYWPNAVEADGSEHVFLPEEDKQVYKSYILEGYMGIQDNSIRALLVETIHIIARADFPVS